MKKITIALADDHQLVRHGIKLMIESFTKFEVVCEASNGKELIKNIEALPAPPNIALIDVSMPVMNGFETIQYLVKHHKTVSCIALSVHNDFNTVFRMIDRGAKGYLQKDNTPEYVRKTIMKVYTTGSDYDSFVAESLMEYQKNKSEKEREIKLIPGVNELSPRETEFVLLCCSEYIYKEIATRMNVSERTIDSYREIVFKKIGAKTRFGILLYAVDVGLYKPKIY